MTEITAINDREITERVQSDRSRWIALVVLCAGMLMIVLDETIVNVALPSIQDDLGFSQSSLAWVVNAYLITFGGLLLLAGRLGDLIGRSASSWPASPCSPPPRCSAASRRARRCWSAPASCRASAARMTSAVILGHDRDDVPGAAGAGEGDRRLQLRRRRPGVRSACCRRRAHPGDQLALDLLRQPPDRRSPPRSLRRGWSSATRASASEQGADVLGRVLITAALMLGVYTIVKPAADDGWGRSDTLGPRRRRRWCCSAAFIAREATARTPLMPLRIFRSRNVSGANADPGAVRRRDVRHVLPRRALHAAGARLRRAGDRPGVPAGRRSSSATLSLAILGRSSCASAPRRRCSPAWSLIVVGLVLFARAPVDGELPDRRAARRWCCSASARGSSFPALMTLAMSGATPEDAGLASGLVNTPLQVGGALGPGGAGDAVDDPHREPARRAATPRRRALTGGYHLAFWIGAGLVIAAIGDRQRWCFVRPALAEAEAVEGAEGELEVEGEPALWEAA